MTIAALAGAAVVVGFAAPAQARVIPDAITSVKTQTSDTKIADGRTQFSMEMEFALGRGADRGGLVQAGDTFTLRLDPRLNTIPTFNITDGGQVIATMTKDPATGIATFTLTDYAQKRDSTTGRMNWRVSFREPQTPKGTYTLVNNTFSTTVEVLATYVPVEFNFNRTKYKQMYAHGDSLSSSLVVLYGGIGPITTQTITDTYTPTPGGAPWEFVCSETKLEFVNGTNTNAFVAPPENTFTCNATTLTATYVNVPADRVPVVKATIKTTVPEALQGALILENTAHFSTDYPGETSSQDDDKSQQFKQDFGGSGSGTITPDFPTFTEAICTPAAPGQYSPASVNIPVDNGFDYVVTGTEAPGQTVTVTATPMSGLSVPDGDFPGWTRTTVAGVPTFTLTHTFAEIDCVQTSAPLATPVFTDVACTGPGAFSPASIAALSNTTGVTYALPTSLAPGTTAVVTATLAEGYRFPATLPTGWVLAANSSSATFAVTVGNPDCVVEADALSAPVFTDVACTTPGQTSPASFAALENTTGVTYEVPDALTRGATVTVKATLAEGYRFPAELAEGWTVADDGTATRSFEVSDPDCVVTSGAIEIPVFTDVACTTPGNFDPASIADLDATGVRFTMPTELGAGTEAVVTAALTEGYRFPAELPAGWELQEDGTASFAITVSAPDCVVDTEALAAPEVTLPVCVNSELTNGGLAGVATTGVSYAVDGEAVAGGTATVTATAVEGYRLSLAEGWVATSATTAVYEHRFPAVECSAITPGTDGGSTSGSDGVAQPGTGGDLPALGANMGGIGAAALLLLLLGGAALFVSARRREDASA